MENLFGGVYKGTNVLVTGHTGFKGSWLCNWLHHMGAKVKGYALSLDTTPNHFDLLDLPMTSVIADIRDSEKLLSELSVFEPAIVFHLAAQPLVRYSYQNPIETFHTNVLGTANLLEACRQTASVKAVINVTSDKCYQNNEWVWGYREIDPLGGHDPYSASKACAEIVTTAYRKSFFEASTSTDSSTLLVASARAGNVIGGGDWSQDRIVTDLVESAASGKQLTIRNPNSVRPWQHVLEPLSGYLQLGQKLLNGERAFAEAWNFGPADNQLVTVEGMVQLMKPLWDKVDYQVTVNKDAPHEAGMLNLDCSKVHNILKWSGIWDKATTFAKTINWYKEFYETKAVTTNDQLASYIEDADKASMEWTR